MLSEKHFEAVEETAEELKRRRENRAAAGAKAAQRPQTGKLSQADRDHVWARENLRFKGGEPMLDIANVLRVFERHEAFAGRFKFNEALNKVLDKGTVMLDWRVAEVVAVIQERFLPEVSEAAVQKALLVHANRVIQKK